MACLVVWDTCRWNSCTTKSNGGGGVEQECQVVVLLLKASPFYMLKPETET